jgi:hypothetical protein
MKPVNTKSALASKAIIRFNALLRELYPNNHAEAKAGILSGYEVESTKSLTESQLLDIIDGLVNEKSKRMEDVPKSTRILRSRCIAIMDDIGVGTDWLSRNAFCEKPTVLNKRRLYDLNETELEAFRKKLFAIKGEYERRLADEITWAKSN